MKPIVTLFVRPLDHEAWQGRWDGIHVRLGSAPGAVPAPAAADPLTPREREIACLVVLGLSNREIGERLHVAMGTVRKHRENLMTKLGVRNLAGLTQWAHSVQLLQPAPPENSSTPKGANP